MTNELAGHNNWWANLRSNRDCPCLQVIPEDTINYSIWRTSKVLLLGGKQGKSAAGRLAEKYVGKRFEAGRQEIRPPKLDKIKEGDLPHYLLDTLPNMTITELLETRKLMSQQWKTLMREAVEKLAKWPGYCYTALY